MCVWGGGVGVLAIEECRRVGLAFWWSPSETLYSEPQPGRPANEVSPLREGPPAETPDLPCRESREKLIKRRIEKERERERERGTE